ncbi:MAG: DUF3618 domain-containing protein [Rhodoplanes sp.]
MASTRDLESQAKTERSQIAATLDELRGRMSTGQLVDQALSYTRGHGGAEFMRTLGNEVKTNPLPIALLAVGLGWLMVGQRRPEAGASAPSIVPDDPVGPGGKSPNDRFDELARDTSGEVASALRNSPQGAAERAQSAFAGARENAEQATSTAFDTMVAAGDRTQSAAAMAGESLSSAYDAASGAVGRASSAVSDTATALGRRTHDVRDRALHIGNNTASRARRAGQSVAEQAGQAQNAISQLIHEQPVIVGAIGLATGAIIGACLPRSRPEDKLMGETSESFKAAAVGTVREQFAHVQEAGGRIVEKVRSAADDQGLSPGTVQSVVPDIGARVSAVAAAAKEGTEDELKSAKGKAENELSDTLHGDRNESDVPEHSEDSHVHEAAGPERFSAAGS